MWNISKDQHIYHTFDSLGKLLGLGATGEYLCCLLFLWKTAFMDNCFHKL